MSPHRQGDERDADHRGRNRGLADGFRRDRLVRRVILVEGFANLVVLLAKLIVGLSTGSLAVLSDAVHSLTDVANNAVAWIVIKVSSQPADREHPYGHRKFETLAVFGLATLLAVLAFELALHAIRREEATVVRDAWALGIMLGVLGVNVAIASWQRYWARRLQSDIILADANHTFADVLTTIVVIGGWQLSAMGYPWLDSVCALGVAALVMYLAYGLFKRAFPVLVDQFAIAPELLADAARSVPGVRKVRRIRSRSVGSTRTVDMVVTVDPELSTTEAHAIADAIERRLEDRHQVGDASIHIEPENEIG
ncbi:MAG: cation transporter [Inquilinus sp.]|nr:cation transporter [Inquilinus sp.]